MESQQPSAIDPVRGSLETVSEGIEHETAGVDHSGIMAISNPKPLKEIKKKISGKASTPHSNASDLVEV